MTSSFSSVAQRIATGLAKIGTALRANAWQEAGPRGLTPTQGQALAFLAVRSGASLLEVAEGLAVRPATASEAVGALERKSLVRKSRHPTNGRSLWLTLTPEGHALAQETRHWPDFLAAVADGLDPEEQGVFLRAVIAMIAALEEKGQIPRSRMCATCAFFRPNRHPGAKKPHHCAFIDAPLGIGDLRLDCPDQDPLPEDRRGEALQVLRSSLRS
jgi:DNA-binding MarR family transcriptional regulator